MGVVTIHAGLLHQARRGIAKGWSALVILEAVHRLARILSQALQRFPFKTVLWAAVAPRAKREIAVEANLHARVAAVADLLTEFDGKRCRNGNGGRVAGVIMCDAKFARLGALDHVGLA